MGKTTWQRRRATHLPVGGHKLGPPSTGLVARSRRWDRYGKLLGDDLGLLQNRVEVFCLDELVGLPMLKGFDAAHRQAGRSSCPGIGEVHNDEPSYWPNIR